MHDAVVITGAGLVCSLGSTRGQVWNALLNGESGVRSIEGFDARGFGCRFAAQIQGLDPGDLGIQPKLAEMMGKHLSMLLRCTEGSFLQCNLGSVPREEIGFFAGMGMVDYEVGDLIGAVSQSTTTDGTLSYDAFYSGAYREIYPLWPLAMLNNVAFCQVAVRLDIRGENTVFSPHADSGAQALAEGVQTVLERKAQVVLAGGVSESVSPLSLVRAHLAGILSTGRGGGESRCLPFAAQRNGTLLGEGCGMVSLELRSAAAARGVPCLARISGSGSAYEVETEAPAPTAGAISRAMRLALTNAGIEPADIDVVVAHGDGTFVGDRNELEAIHQVYSSCLRGLRVFSSKGALGLMFAASPAVDTILAVEMLRNGIIPATLTAGPIDPSIEFDLVRGAPSQTRAKRIMVNSSSYEGQCTSLIIEAVD